MNRERPGETGGRFALRSEIVIVLELVLGSFIIAAQERLLRDNSERSSAIRQTERTTTRKNRGRGRLRLSSMILIPAICAWPSVLSDLSPLAFSISSA